MKWKLYEGDCLKIMPELEDKSIDMILCDLPYGTTACKWDSIIPLEPLWNEYKRLIKDNGAIVLTASQPFTTKLISSNYDWFKYEWVWEKSNPANISAKVQPMKYHENILIFYKNSPCFNKQMIKRESRRIEQHIKNNYTSKCTFKDLNSVNNTKYYSSNKYDPNWKNPSSILKFNSIPWNSNEKKPHPTQKPVALFEYLIKTYTNENDLVLDNCAGSGTTGVACYNTNRNCIMIEKEPKYCDVIRERMHEVTAQKRLEIDKGV
jgi:site-specific DNA-methyltransferase (adenine-specific)